MRRFHVCIHDATPLYARETRVLIRDLAPLIGRRLSFGVVPNWHGEWPLTAHPEYCSVLREGAEELLLHGYLHRRRRGRGPVALVAGSCDEMNGLDRDETGRTIERGQQVFMEAFGAAARGFLPPAWQRGHVRAESVNAFALDHVLGFFTLEAGSGRTIPLTTWTWDCGRWDWLGHIGHGLGWLLHSFDRGVPVLAIHPRDLERGFWPAIVQLTGKLLDSGYEPSTLSALLEARDAEDAA